MIGVSNEFEGGSALVSRTSIIKKHEELESRNTPFAELMDLLKEAEAWACIQTTPNLIETTW